ncbi:10124_t:CDS:1, partial [Ambispora leptoticha]
MTTHSLQQILISEIAALLEDTEDQDFSIKVGQGNDVKIFTAHSLILRARSQYFKVALSQLWIRNMQPIIFEKIL